MGRSAGVPALRESLRASEQEGGLLLCRLRQPPALVACPARGPRDRGGDPALACPGGRVRRRVEGSAEGRGVARPTSRAAAATGGQLLARTAHASGDEIGPPTAAGV